MKRYIKSIGSYCSPALLVLLFGSIILAVQGIWPFGSETVYYYDMGQEIAAQYMQIYDEIHFSKSFLFDWYVNLGRGIPGGTLVSIQNFFLYFIPRDKILEAFSIMLIVKMMIMSITMRIFLKRCVRKCPDFYSVVLSTGYAFCGYVLMYYSIIRWLDIAAIVPLLFLFTQKALKEGKVTGYVTCLALSMLITFYEPMMLLVFIFLITGLFLLCEKLWGRKDSSLHVCSLGIATIIGLLISMWSWLPEMCDAFSDMRFCNESKGGLSSLYMDILSCDYQDYTIRWWVLLGSSFAIAICLAGLFKDIKYKNWKRFTFVLGTIFVTFSELVFNSIQLIWRFDSYMNYPIRNGFLIYIIFAGFAAFYASDLLSEEAALLNSKKTVKKVKVYSRGRVVGYENEVKTGLNIFVGAGLIISILLSCAGIFWCNLSDKRSVYDVSAVLVFCALAAALLYLFFIIFNGGKFAKLCIFIYIAEIIFYGVLSIGRPNYSTIYYEQAEQESEYIRITNELTDKLDIKPSYINRIKNPDTSLNANYGMIMKRATFSGYMPYSNSNLVNGAVRMGYSNHNARILDAGGNVFTDALFHVTEVISCIPQDKGIYEEKSKCVATVNHNTGEKRSYTLYDSKYLLPFGTLVENLDKIKMVNSSGLGVDFYNQLFNAVIPQASKNEFTEDGPAVLCEEVEGVCDKVTHETVSIDVSGNKALYLLSYDPSNDTEYENVEIVVNDKIVSIPTIQNLDNTRFTTRFNNSTVFLGTFKDETVDIRMDIDESIEAPEYQVCIYTVDLDMLGKLCRLYANEYSDMTFAAGKRNFIANVTAKKGECLMLPISYDKNWRIKVNGEKAESDNFTGLFTIIPLYDGSNTIEMSYFPKSMLVGIIVSSVTLLVIVILVCLSLNVKMVEEFFGKIRSMITKMNSFVITGYIFIWVAVMVAIYLIPIIYTKYHFLFN